MSKDQQNKKCNNEQLRVQNAIGFWLLGFVNHFGTTVMLTAAYDLLHKFQHFEIEPLQEIVTTTTTTTTTQSTHIDNGRDCNLISTGVILLVVACPSFATKIISSFCPLNMKIRIGLCLLCQVCSYLIVVYANSKLITFFGIALTSINIGLGEASFLSYTSEFDKSTISTFASGTGTSSLIAAIYYSGLKSFGLSTDFIILLLLLIPIFELITFVFIVKKPIHESWVMNRTMIDDESGKALMVGVEKSDFDPTQNVIILDPNYRSVATAQKSEVIEANLTIMDQLKYVPHLVKYMLPIGLVYFLEFLINQGLYELIYFPDIWLNHAAQYRWYITDYTIGVFISRSTSSFIKIPWLWLFVLVQSILLIVLTFEAIYLYIPSIWIIFSLIFVEGLIGGSSYVNTFYLINDEVEKKWHHFSIGCVVVADVFGVMIAGFASIPVHNAICMIPLRS